MNMGIFKGLLVIEKSGLLPPVRYFEKHEM